MLPGYPELHERGVGSMPAVVFLVASRNYKIANQDSRS